MPLPRVSATPNTWTTASANGWTMAADRSAPSYGSAFVAGNGDGQQSGPVKGRQRRTLRGWGTAAAALAIAAGIGFAPLIPSWDGAGSAWTSFLPWTAVLLVLLGALSLIRRSWWACSAVLVALMVWSAVFVPQLIPASGVTGAAAGTADLTVATQNIGAANTDQAAAARQLAATGAGIVSMQEVVGGDTAATAALDAQYAYQARVSSVGLWSQWSMGEPQSLELGLSWARAMRTVVHHPSGDIAVYAVHLPSVRPGDTAARDAAIIELRDLVAADTAPRVLVVGDLNTAGTDPTLTALTAQMADSREAVRGGFGFTWPATFPLTRPDHVLGKSLTPVSDQVLAAAGSDHRGVLVGLDF
ncbi:MAG: endonuclease/exonuclease/phosphatase family protein [Nakamurella sp.]